MNAITSDPSAPFTVVTFCLCGQLEVPTEASRAGFEVQQDAFNAAWFAVKALRLYRAAVYDRDGVVITTLQNEPPAMGFATRPGQIDARTGQQMEID